MRLSFASRSFISLVFIVPSLCATIPRASLKSRAFVSGQWSLEQQGETGVSAQQLAVVSEKTVIIFDKVERNPMTVKGHPAWASEFNLETKEARPLNPISNTWCGTGSFLGNAKCSQGISATSMKTQVASGLLPSVGILHLSVRIEDGSVMIWGGSTSGGFINGEGVNNPSYEFYPPKNIN
ncbi:hypothetical protein MPER_06549, partial [Moniliophthora perniciosa FA553]